MKPVGKVIDFFNTWGHHSIESYIGVFEIPQGTRGAVKYRGDTSGGKAKKKRIK